VPYQDTYTKAVKISEDYLGPAGERFIRRQIITHLHIEPEELQEKQLPELAEWLHAAFAVITRDIQYVNEYVQQILALSSTKSAQSVGIQHDTVN
jgi:hypothetical protein